MNYKLSTSVIYPTKVQLFAVTNQCDIKRIQWQRQWFIVMNASTAINMSSEYHCSNNVSQFLSIKWIDARQPQRNHNQHGMKPVALELRASSADEERRPVRAVADRQNTLETGDDGGQKMRGKQILSCCAKSVRATWADTLCKICK
jgi:hypothetical protein